MTQLQINNVTGLTIPYQIYICDVYGNQCVLVANVLPPQPPTIVITIPSQFNTAPAVGIKLIDSLGCEILKIVDCTQQYLTIKQFQDGDDFYFMDNEEYDFQT
jgi:hypothetical protein